MSGCTAISVIPASNRSWDFIFYAKVEHRDNSTKRFDIRAVFYVQRSTGCLWGVDEEMAVALGDNLCEVHPHII